MDNKIVRFVKNVGAMLFANGIAFLISALVTFIVPKFLNVEDYAYVQLYIFYTSYISYLHYGWVDGIRLRYGGAYYKDLDKPLFSSQILSYSLLQIIISVGVVLFVCGSGFSGNRRVALLAVGLCMLIRLPRLMPQYILEMTNRIRECARITIIERMVYLILTVFVIATNRASVWLLLACDLCGQLAAAIYAFICCKDIIRVKPVTGSLVFNEAGKNIYSGIQLTVANVSSLLIIGVIRQCIETQWDVQTFGKISLTISISNLLMVFIRAVSMVMFPTLRRIDKSKLKSIYSTVRVGLMIPLLGMLVVYYPVKVLMSMWLPQYSESLKYMALLFPMCVFESKMSMLIETYLKTLRLEKWLFRINVLTVGLSVLLAFLTTFVLHSLTMAVLAIVFLLAFRCVLTESILAVKLKIRVRKHILLELLLTTIFIISSWFIGGIIGTVTYLIFYLIYLLIVKKDAKKMLSFLKKR